ncbi:growth factor receptor-bound protein 2a [Nerophis ophidion]|uniref:growth factor receptor-bound protein 2a n=1 Tax=Nerophis ophidion TaxID=159077 RepID=UPI002AE0AB61|nr:growth factor receptor-bound protein 2a [Nerophis ophidion]
MEAVALLDYKAANANELSFSAGDKLQVFQKDSDWCKAELRGIGGFVHSNYIRYTPHPWFLGKVDKAEAEEILKDMPHNGNFLVRENEHSPGSFKLSVKSGNGVEHFDILRDGSGQYFIWVVKFKSINELVSYFHKSSVSQHHSLILKTDELQPEKQRFVAIDDFEPQEKGELALKKGDVIKLYDDSLGQWWKGECNGKMGMFHRTYVTPLEK